MAPPPRKALGGRGNPHGIPYLYLASDRETAIAEIRPSISEDIWLGRLSAKKKLAILDLSTGGIVSPFRFKPAELSRLLAEARILRIFRHELSKPIRPSDASIEYVPTQYLCERIKALGYAGLMYGSAMGPGINYLFFSPSDFEVVDKKDVRIKKVTYETDTIL